MKILVTGANGFLGRGIIEFIIKNRPDLEITAAVRSVEKIDNSFPYRQVFVGNINHDTNWTLALNGQDCVIHAAALAHVGNRRIASSEYMLVNYEGTVQLARQAAKAGVRRFIFLSTIGVNGIRSKLPFKATDTPSPENSYSISKFRAEEALWNIQKSSNMELVIIRPPLIYGTNAPGNFQKLVRLLRNNIPLPFQTISNKRSFISLNNICDFIMKCVDHPSASNCVFLIADGEDVSTPEFLENLGDAMGVKVFNFPFPKKILIVIAKILGQKNAADSLLENLQIDISDACQRLNWRPPQTLTQGLNDTFRSVNQKQIGSTLK